jgi:hypothetical protein
VLGLGGREPIACTVRKAPELDVSLASSKRHSRLCHHVAPRTGRRSGDPQQVQLRPGGLRVNLSGTHPTRLSFHVPSRRWPRPVWQLPSVQVQNFRRLGGLGGLTLGELGVISASRIHPRSRTEKGAEEPPSWPCTRPATWEDSDQI